eukprot:scaffold2098_cov235-Pinguiococcus_pyrenoidosus.AAC.1
MRSRLVYTKPSPSFSTSRWASRLQPEIGGPKKTKSMARPSSRGSRSRSQVSRGGRSPSY